MTTSIAMQLQSAPGVSIQRSRNAITLATNIIVTTRQRRQSGNWGGIVAIVGTDGTEIVSTH
jgi:hypothetical protein